jgi:two-component system nitrogen regulation response regulator NtrX
VAQQPPRIFVVDDAPLIASTIADILRMSGFSAASFTDPREALAAAIAESPDLLLCDLYMPDLSGLELASLLKSAQLDCDIILFSGHPHAADLVDEARDRGHLFKFLHKPIPPLQLIHEVSAGCPRSRL